MTSDQMVALAMPMVVIAIVFLILYFVAKRNYRIRDRLIAYLQQNGIADVRKKKWGGLGGSGLWQGYPMRLIFRTRVKQVPANVSAIIELEGPARITIKRKFEGFFSNKPLTMFGPPLVDLPQFASAQRFWVRSDEASLVERLLSDAKIVAMLEQNLVEAFDEVVLNAKQLRVVRAADERSIKQLYGKDLIEASARIGAEEWPLATGIVQTLSLRPRR